MLTPDRIFAVRKIIRAFYDYRISSLEARLSLYQADRATTIQKLKDATKYDSTLQLLQKYGGGGTQPPQNDSPANKKRSLSTGGAGRGESRRDASSQERPRSSAGALPARTSLSPPPTANLSWISPKSPTLPQLHFPEPPTLPQPIEPPRQYEPVQPQWYDRLLDVLMGEDETSARNRIALICWSCRLVNGQAPPGTRTLADVGVWRCKECKATNGVDAKKKLVDEVLNQKEGKKEDDEKDSGDLTPVVEVDEAERLVATPDGDGVRRRIKGGD